MPEMEYRSLYKQRLDRFVSSLTHLKLNSTKIKKLPKEIGQLTSLVYLGLSKSSIRKLPWEINQLTSLSCLDVSGTKITKPPKYIANSSIFVFEKEDI